MFSVLAGLNNELHEALELIDFFLDLEGVIMMLSSATHIFRFRGDNINTINELVNNEIWHSKISGLNDPFDMFFSFDAEELRRLDKSDIATIIKNTTFLRLC
ncbi:hypothetical protein ACO1Y9_27935 [Klebsiella quasipneumoniae]|uniref:hypothetical protein n=1 Tax=Klebsiella quasipneumoniae TaxID=1463165 RepID=UPI003BF678C8